MNKQICDVDGCHKDAFLPYYVVMGEHRIRLIGYGARSTRQHGPFSFDLCADHYREVLFAIKDSILKGETSQNPEQPRIFNPECKADDVDLCSCTDGRIWAREFARRYPQIMCQIPEHEGVENDVESVMLGWFANAIMAGIDSVKRTT